MVQEQNIQHWSVQRYSLTREYVHKPVFVPPFSFISHLVHLVSYVLAVKHNQQKDFHSFIYEMRKFCYIVNLSCFKIMSNILVLTRWYNIFILRRITKDTYLIAIFVLAYLNPKRAGGGRIRPPLRHFLLYLCRLLFFRAETS